MQATDSQTRVIVQTAYEKLIERSKAEGRAEGEAEGRAEGKAQGRAEGKAQGRAEGKAEMLLQLVQARFGAVPPVVHERIHDARADQLDRWAQRLLTASTLDELFVD